MTTQPNTGPAELRRIARTLLSGGLDPVAHAVSICAGAWEADVAASERRREDLEMYLAKLQRAEAALERARALMGQVQFDYENRCPFCHGGKEWQEFKHTPDCPIAAALSAPDGAR